MFSSRHLPVIVSGITVLATGWFILDLVMNWRLFGWDAHLVCAAVDAHVRGANPYYVENLDSSGLSYTYLPVTLDVFRPLCAAGLLTGHYKFFYLLAGCAIAALVSWTDSANFRTAAMKAAFCLLAFAGFQWVMRTGNVAIFDAFLVACALFALFRSWFVVGAVLLGFACSLKLSYVPVLLPLWCLPVARRRRLTILVAAICAYALPVLVSALCYGRLFRAWIDCVLGRIPNQHALLKEPYTPSLYSVATFATNWSGRPASMVAASVVYVLLVIAVLALLVLRVRQVVSTAAYDDQSSASGSSGGWLSRFDRFLLSHPKSAMHLAVLSMFALMLCLPRLKEYVYFQMAIYGAIAVSSLPAARLAAAFFFAMVLPVMANTALPILFSVVLPALIRAVSGQQVHWEAKVVFDQLAAALLCFVVLLGDLAQYVRREEAARQEAA